MSRTVSAVLVLFLCVVAIGARPVHAAVAPQIPSPTASAAAEGQLPVQRAVQAVVARSFSQCTADAIQPGHPPAVYRICRPPNWWFNNNDLVIWAHGYVDILQPVAIPEDQLCPTPDLCIPDLTNFLGYNFATTSYEVNGLAILPGIQDVLELVDLYTAQFGAPEHVLLVGASEGGLVTTLSVEQHADVYDGGLAICGPIGNFRGQVNYFGNFRMVFDYFFPGLVPGDPLNVPPELLPIWETYYAENVEPVVFDPANAGLLQQLVSVTEIPVDPNNPEATTRTSVHDVLWYNILATNNAAEVLGGQPFGNQFKVYRGSNDDEALNAGVQRATADPAAVAEIEAHYQTSGVLSAPLVTLHTTMDQQVPFWHEILYLGKTMASGSWPTFHVLYPPVQAYGHCIFTVRQELGAFAVLVRKVGDMPPDQELVEALLAALGPQNQVMTLGR